MEKEMQYDIIQLMESLKEAHKGKEFQDVLYLGAIDYREASGDMSYDAQKDIFVVIEEKDGIISYHYYDENQELIAVDLGNEQGLMAGKDFFKDKDFDFTQDMLKTISELDQNGLSLEEIDLQLEAYAKELGISKEEILSATTLDLDQKVSISKEEQDPKKENEDQIDLDEDQQSEETKKQNEDKLDHIAAKSEVDLNKKVTGKQTLAQLLGVPASGKLIAVYSDHIAHNQNTADYSFLIQKPDGSLEKTDNILDQMDGNSPTRDIAAVNRDGSKVENQQANSMYRIHSGNDDMLSVKIGSLGTLELSYVEKDPTQDRYQSIQLETNQMRPITTEVKQAFDHERGTRHTTNNINELEEAKADCKEKDCDHKPTIKDADGDPRTGHHHVDENDPELGQIVNELLEVDEIAEVYNRQDVKNFYLQLTKDDPDLSLDEIEEQIMKKANQEHEFPGQSRH